MNESAGLTQTAVIKEHAPTTRLSCLAAMRERSGDVVCFTPALLVTHGKMPADPVGEFVARFNVAKDEQPFCVEVFKPVFPFFTGLGVSQISGNTIDWDRRLYAIPRAQSSTCLNFLGGLGVSGSDFFASAVTYEISIPDPTMSQFTNSAVFIPVHIFGVLANNNVTYLEPNGVLPPFVKTIPANIALEHTNSFKRNSFTEADFKKLRGET